MRKSTTVLTSALAETAALLVLGKKRKQSGYPRRTRATDQHSRSRIPYPAGIGSGCLWCNAGHACKELGISTRTFQGLVSPDTPHEDRRPLAVRPEPRNMLTLKEKEVILMTVNRPQNADKPPSQIVSSLENEEINIASESSFYRVMHEEA